MIKKLFCALAVTALFSNISHADQIINAAKLPSFDKQTWAFYIASNKKVYNGLTISNPSGAPLSLMIEVDQTSLSGTDNSSITVTNCGGTAVQVVTPGGSIVCGTISATNPVSFSAMNIQTGSNGWYQVEQQSAIK